MGRNDGVDVGQDIGLQNVSIMRSSIWTKHTHMFELSEDINFLKLSINFFSWHLAILLDQVDELADNLLLGLAFNSQVHGSLCAAAEASWGHEILIFENLYSSDGAHPDGCCEENKPGILLSAWPSAAWLAAFEVGERETSNEVECR